MKVVMNTTANAKFSPGEKIMEHSTGSYMPRKVKPCHFFRRKGSSIKMDEEN